MTGGGDDYDPFFDGAGFGFLDAVVRPAGDTAETASSFEADDTRAYLLTGGRTGGGRAGVSMETIVVADRLAMTTAIGHPEMDAIIAQAQEPVATAEISSRLGLPLGVVQVLVGDLVADGRLIPSERKLEMHRDVAFLERLIDRVSAL